MLNDASNEHLEYGGFWIRAAALVLDVLIVLPMSGALFWLFASNPADWIYMAVPNIVFSVCYEVLLVRRFGGTPGKLLVGLQIIGVEGSPITTRQAFARQAPGLAFAICMMVGSAIAAGRLSELESRSFCSQAAQVAPLMPWWTPVVRALRTAWNLSELVVLLTNEKRRALHDFLAGTVVIKRRRDAEPRTVVRAALR
jgi:uncharacterized RDD family membrane protein YckC